MSTKPRKKRQEWEARYASDYVSTTYPNTTVFLRLKLGSLPTPLSSEELTESERRSLAVRQRWLDAAVILPNSIRLIEAKLRAHEYLTGIAQLEAYRVIAPHTPEFGEYLPRRFEPMLVVPLRDDLTEFLCHQKNIMYVVFRPTWFENYLQTLLGRHKRTQAPKS